MLQNPTKKAKTINLGGQKCIWDHENWPTEGGWSTLRSGQLMEASNSNSNEGLNSGPQKSQLTEVVNLGGILYIQSWFKHILFR